ncbi:hypothetical protein P152DRAFT_247941 [Eremomyces bilateralis CBS 781.70]|uniref:Uncharacterized protein n=1 Tax=Eremomyces bilateralis CBS 781.70 TaxID=1392243 RepID=A0A6G1GBE0_9PEZI|nr:uncharacterized protein P152DRAFT_247941 [Eremomyces bilateralis CBS 781.70]KAF1815169.1 hypothetical protein P152DRAFT_247941 [Eremomyces bilateralis CBS 781.70]
MLLRRLVCAGGDWCTLSCISFLPLVHRQSGSKASNPSSGELYCLTPIGMRWPSEQRVNQFFVKTSASVIGRSMRSTRRNRKRPQRDVPRNEEGKIRDGGTTHACDTTDSFCSTTPLAASKELR